MFELSENNRSLAPVFSKYTSYFEPCFLALETISRHCAFNISAPALSSISSTSYKFAMSQNNNLAITNAEFVALAAVTTSDTSQSLSSTPTCLVVPVTPTPDSQSSGRVVDTSNLRSYWWRFYTRREQVGGIHRAECMHCDKSYQVKNGVISSMKGHIERKHPEELAGTVGADGATDAGFSQEKFEKDISEWISGDCLAFNTIQSPRVKRMIANLSTKATVPSPKKFKRVLGDIYVEKKQQLMDKLANAPGNISLTIDIWTSRMQDSYLGVTAH